MNDIRSSCACGSGQSYAACCQPIHEGHRTEDPAAVMRARYCAYVLDLNAFLLDSWHPDTRPAALGSDPRPTWKHLQIIRCDIQDRQAQVHFQATGLAAGHWFVLEEQSRFLWTDGQWRYHSGEVAEHALRPGRNDPCPCGSGRKLKRCCIDH